MSFDGVGLHDRQVIAYMCDMLLDFVHIDNLYPFRDAHGERLDSRVEVVHCGEAESWLSERETHRHVGDHCMFIVGLFPESLTCRRRPLSPEYYVEKGKRSYLEVSRIDGDRPSGTLFRKMSDRFEECVVGLHLERNYLNDPFYQYLMRQMLE